MISLFITNLAEIEQPNRWAYHVEVFRTNITSPYEAGRLAAAIHLAYPCRQVNFDLEDCDHVLRIAGERVPALDIVILANRLGYTVQVMD
jgi:hypothetical protein